MKIAMILPSLANKGPILVTRDLCIEYKKMGHECSVFYFDDIVEVELPCPSKRISFWRPIDWNAFDIVHSHMYRSDAYVFFHKPILRKCRTKFITTLHQHIAEQMPFDFPAAKASFVIHTWLLFLRQPYLAYRKSFPVLFQGGSFGMRLVRWNWCRPAG